MYAYERDPISGWPASSRPTVARLSPSCTSTWIDLDAYLWAPLPARLTGAAIIAQSSEEDCNHYDRVVGFFLRSAGYLLDFIREHAPPMAPKYGP